MLSVLGHSQHGPTSSDQSSTTFTHATVCVTLQVHAALELLNLVLQHLQGLNQLDYSLAYLSHLVTPAVLNSRAIKH